MHPAFFDEAPRILVRDPLADLLGAAAGGLLEYHYLDAVRVAGHSCPTVAGAWLMARAALRALYPHESAERGGITVQMPAPEDEGVTGVISQVLTLVTGAAAGNGFHGISGRFVRQGLLGFADAPDGEAVRFTRRDNGKSVMVALDLSSVPPSPKARALMGAAMQPDATAVQRAAFGAAWQDRVRRLLLEHADDPAVLRVTPLA
ncbi:hypothetical protein B0E52_07745 [Rhodanobacter sp. C06]|uniref:FmdE family protein n=1 Tax=Rhodanobacter sp. C06 TaxID=1945854 RepID=UPI0009860D31|nr:FmdE family protein [Rhodanobacter sp. C06]OOG44278.1 hypothetical protein B0E52_07745 [Rhodanobacter sp. C06]